MDDLPKEGEMIYLYWHLEKGIVLPEKNLVDTDASVILKEAMRMKKNKEGTQVAKHKDKKSFKGETIFYYNVCACYNLVGSVCACAGRNAFVSM